MLLLLLLRLRTRRWRIRLLHLQSVRLLILLVCSPPFHPLSELGCDAQ
jgi:hypothetical protein